jgi:hypothetical protein
MPTTDALDRHVRCAAIVRSVLRQTREAANDETHRGRSLVADSASRRQSQRGRMNRGACGKTSHTCSTTSISIRSAPAAEGLERERFAAVVNALPLRAQVFLRASNSRRQRWTGSVAWWGAYSKLAADAARHCPLCGSNERESVVG